MLFFGEWLLLSGVWALAAIVAEVDSRLMQNIGVALAHSAILGYGVSFLIGAFWTMQDPTWLDLLQMDCVNMLATYLIGQVLARIAYVADGSQANKMALTAVVGYELVTLFWRWAVSY